MLNVLARPQLLFRKAGGRRSFRQLERLVRTHAIFPPLPRMKRCFSDYYRSVNWYFVSLYVILQCLECLRQYIEYLQ